jgi:hypothetical protein
MHHRFLTQLEGRDTPVVIITGDYEQRQRAAIAAVGSLCGS